MYPQALLDHGRAQAQLVLSASAHTRSEWAAMGTDFDTSWATVGPRVTLLTAAAQLGAAKNGAAYVPAVLAETGQAIDAVGAVNPRAFAGIASDGRPLDSLLYGAVTTAKTASQTMAPPEALAAGGRWLDMVVQTMVADAARGAAGVAITTRTNVGWIRMTGGKSCSRCAALAGKWFRYNQGFLSHPRCNCYHIPVSEASSSTTKVTSPDDLFRAGRITDLSKAETQALRDGADFSQVVNAKRGAAGMTTTEGTTRRGVYGGYSRGADGLLTKLTRAESKALPPRLTPAGIYRIASDRTEALKLLNQFGYLL